MFCSAFLIAFFAKAPSRSTKKIHKTQFVLILVLACILGISGFAQADSDRGGFTLSIYTGAGGFSSFQIDGDNVLEPAIAPVSIGVGGFVWNRFALLLRASATVFRYSPQGMGSAESRLEPTLTRSLFLGLSAQHWVSDSWTVEASMGFSFVGNGPIEAQLNRGIGMSARLGHPFAQIANGSVSAVWELSPSIYSRRETTVSSTLGLKWQLP